MNINDNRKGRELLKKILNDRYNFEKFSIDSSTVSIFLSFQSLENCVGRSNHSIEESNLKGN